MIRKRKSARVIMILFSLMLMIGMMQTAGTAHADESQTVNIVLNGLHSAETPADGFLSADNENAAPGESVTITANAAASAEGESYYLSQIRIGYKDSEGSDVYQTLKTYKDMTGSQITVSFTVPEDSQDGTVTVYGDYISVVWDGTVDLTWYDKDSDNYEIKYAAQWAGAAAYCNGLFNDIPVREVQTKDSKGNTVKVNIPDLEDENGEKVGIISGEECTDDTGKYNGDYFEGTIASDNGSGYQVFADIDGDGLDTPVAGDLSQFKIRNSNSDGSGGNNLFTTSTFWFGTEDYTGKTVNITQDLDMGGVLKEGARKTDPGKFAVVGKDSNGKDCYMDDEGNVVKGDQLYDPNWKGPNYMPVGGGYVMDVFNGYTKIGSGFNGHLNGQGHMVDNICMMRHVSTGEFGNSQHTGLIGLLGSYRIELTPQDYPVIENVAVDGFMYGNRMVGAIAGETYHSKKLEIRNCMNFATVYNTDAKGCAGIVGSGIYSIEYGDPQPVIRNCANFGYICTGYNKGGAGLVGYSESLVYDSYNVGYVGHDGRGEPTSAQSLGTNNGGAVWYNDYALSGSSWHALSGADVDHGETTPEVHGTTIGSAIMAKDAPDDLKTATFLGMLNGKVKNGGTDKNGYLTSDDSVIKNTKRNWTRGEETSEKSFVSEKVKHALENVQSWHDPADTKDTFSGFSVSDVAKKLKDLDATGMPVPVTFMQDAADFTGISYTGSPRTDYLEGERFDTGDHSKQSPGPGSDEPDSDSEFSIWANYSDGSFAEITDYDIIYQHGGDSFKAGDTTVRVEAGFGGETFSKDFDITVAANKLLSLEVTSLPTSTLYAKNEYFSPDGMTVTTRYGAEGRPVMAVKTTWADGKPSVRRSTEPASDDSGKIYFPADTYVLLSDTDAETFAYSFSPDTGTRLTPADEKITVSQTFAGDTQSDEFEIRTLEGEAPMIRKDSYNNWSIDIDSEDDLIWFANKINTKEKVDMGAALLADITVSDSDFDPIGLYRDSSIAYKGEFYGNGHTINMDLQRSGKPAALFYNLGSGGMIKDLNISGKVEGGTGSDKAATANNAVSSIAVTVNGGTIEDCTNKADITADETVHAGGIAGDLKGGNINNCVNEGAIEGGCYYTGGIIAKGTTSGKMTGCRNNGPVTAGSAAEGANGKDHAAGGIAGVTKDAALKDCVNTAKVTGKTDTQTGGITGTLYEGGTSPTLEGCVNTGIVEVKNGTEKAIAGGIAGSVYSTGSSMKIQRCLNVGIIKRDDDAVISGALVGSGTKLTAAQLKNITGNTAQKCTDDLLIKAVSSAAEGNIKNENMAFSDDMTAAFSELDLSEEYDQALSAIAENVEAVIDEIGEVTEESRDALIKARKAYDSLPELIKNKVTNYQTLTDAEAAYRIITGEDPVEPEPEKINIKTKTITLSKTKWIFTGSAIKPAVTVKGLTKGTDYTLSYANNKAIGKASVKITGKGSYEGSVTKTFTIIPKKVTGLKLTKGKKMLTVRFTKTGGGVTYQVAYRKAGTTKYTSKKTSSNKLMIKKLKSKKYYQVRVRAFKKVNGITYYGAWSQIKKIKTK